MRASGKCTSLRARSEPRHVRLRTPRRCAARSPSAPAFCSPFVTVLDAERQLAETRTQLAQSTVNVTTNFIAVYKALGDGWEDDEQAAAQR